MKIAYIAHPIGAVKTSSVLAATQVLNNLALIAKIVRDINLKESEIVPFAPYYLDCVVMDDNDPEERQRGINNDTELLSRGFVDELRLYGSRISYGMLCEIALAKKHGIRVKPMTPETEEQYKNL